MTEVFVSTPTAEAAALAHLLTKLRRIRAAMPPVQFHQSLRKVMLDHPALTLQQVATALDLTRSRVGKMVGALDRPAGLKSAPKQGTAAERLAELSAKVQAGEPTTKACVELGIASRTAYHLGFRVKAIRPPHGSEAKWRTGCQCWRCRKASGVTRAYVRKVMGV